MTAISLIVEFESRPEDKESYAGVDGVALRPAAAVEAFLEFVATTGEFGPDDVVVVDDDDADGCRVNHV